MGEKQSFQLTREDIDDGVTVLAASGDADRFRAEAVTSAIEGAHCEGRDVIVDLTAATYIDSSMIAALVGVTEQGRRRGEPIVVICASDRLRRALQVKGLEPILRLAATREGAIEQIAASGSPSQSA
jgi:anti-sigma B factor antagonist